MLYFRQKNRFEFFWTYSKLSKVPWNNRNTNLTKNKK